MSETKHTKGPWNVKANAYNIPIQIHSNDLFIADCDVHTPYEHLSYEEREANAKLIAAAPDLLRAAKEALLYLEATRTKAPETIKLLGTAIKKATT